jgi:hypothetical protein
LDLKITLGNVSTTCFAVPSIITLSLINNENTPDEVFGDVISHLKLSTDPDVSVPFVP